MGNSNGDPHVDGGGHPPSVRAARLKVAAGLSVALLGTTLAVLDALDHNWSDAVWNAPVVLMGVLFAFGTNRGGSKRTGHSRRRRRVGLLLLVSFLAVSAAGGATLAGAPTLAAWTIGVLVALFVGGSVALADTEVGPVSDLAS